MGLLTFVMNNKLLAIMLAGVAVFVGLHVVWYIHPSDIESVDELQAHVRRGEPTVVEFYTNL